MYRGCIFDLDGTLLNTLAALTLTTNLTLKTLGLGPILEEQTKQFVGDGYVKQLERALAYCGDGSLIHLEEAKKIYMELFKEHCMYELKPYDGIVDLLLWLKNQGYKLAVLSNKPHDRTVENVEGIFGAGYFDVVQGEVPGIPKKPSPEGVFAVLGRLGLKASECLYLGDTNTDMQTGENAGLDTVGVTWGFRDREELSSFRPRYLADHPLDVRHLIEQG